MRGDVATFYMSPDTCLSKHPTDHRARHSCGQVWSHPALCLVTLASVPHCTVGSALWVLMPFQIILAAAGAWRAPLSFPIAGPQRSPLAGCCGSGSTWLLCPWRCSVLVQKSFRPQASSLSAMPKAFFCAFSDKVISLSVFTKCSGPYLT